MAEDLGIEVVRLVRRVVDVELRPLVEEEAVVVHLLAATVQTEEGRDVNARLIVDKLRGNVSEGKSCIVGGGGLDLHRSV